MIRGLENGRKAALVISELQRGVVGDLSPFPALGEQIAKRNVIPHLTALAEAFRKADFPIFHCHVAHRPDYKGVPINTVTAAVMRKKGGMVHRNPAIDPIPEFMPHASDFLLQRAAGMTPFYDNSLDLAMRALGVETLVLAGVSTNMGVPGMALGGVDRGYQVIVAEDCIAGSTPEVHEFLVREQLSLLASIASGADIAAAMSESAA